MHEEPKINISLTEQQMPGDPFFYPLFVKKAYSERTPQKVQAIDIIDTLILRFSHTGARHQIIT
jgi:hypothetical protein